MSSTSREHLRNRYRSSSVTTGNSSGGRTHHKATGSIAPLLKTKNSKIYFSDSDDDNGHSSSCKTTTTTTSTIGTSASSTPIDVDKSQSSHSAAICKTSLQLQQQQQQHSSVTHGTVDTDDLNNLGSTSDNDSVVLLNKIISKHRTNRNKRNMIIYYGREFICVLALILTTYATFQNVPPKISRIAPPKPFFPKGSLVHDYPTGHLEHVQNRVSLSELSLVMFYAPWCAESQYARATYEYVARLFYREAHFAAINCWQPGGECRHQYAKILEWPVVMAYLQNGLAVPYNGKWTRSAVTKFVSALLHPIKRISTTEELLQILMVHDAIVVAFIDVNAEPANYRAFYQTAVKWLEKDPFQNVCFAVVTGESRKHFGVDGSVVRVYLWNDTTEYLNDVWSQPHLHTWINSKIQQISLWLTPPGSKSNTLAPYLKQGPVVMLFTPRNLQADSIDAYTMLRQIGLEYYNCPSVNQDWIKEMSRTYITEQRLEHRNDYERFLRTCEHLMMRTHNTDPIDPLRKCMQPSIDRPISISFGNIVNSSKLPADHCPIGPQNLNEIYDKSSCFLEKQTSHMARAAETCTIVPKSLINLNGDASYGGGFDGPVISMLQTKYDSRSSENLLNIATRKKCEMYFASDPEDVPRIFFAGTTNESNYDKILGLSCKSNRTLSLIAVDSIVYHTFAERLGVDVLRADNKTAAIIIDHENESTYTLTEPITTDSLINFVHNYTTHKLARHLKISDPHYHGQSTRFTSGSDEKDSRTISIRDIDSDNFTEDVLLSDKTVVVLFYSVQCALCSILTQSLLMTSKILAEMAHQIDFVRIDGDRNDLPWQYTMDKFPSLIIFPANRKSESRIYPSTLEVNVQNVLGFVLANMNRPNRLHGLVLVCKNIKKMFPIEDCLAVLRRDIIANISVSLREWRKVPYKRGQILRRLQVLQRFYLHLFRIDNSCDFNSLDVFVRDIGKVWTI